MSKDFFFSTADAKKSVKMKYFDLFSTLLTGKKFSLHVMLIVKFLD